jgi:flagellin
MSFNMINTNTSAMVALQALSRTNDQLETTQKRISTGFRVADARDDGGAFAVAQRVRGDVAGLNSANDQLGAAKGLLDTTLTGLGNISDTLKEVKAVLTELGNSNVVGQQRAAAVEKYSQLRMQVANFVNDSAYNGQTLLGRSVIPPNQSLTAPTAGTSISVIRNERGTSLTIAAIGPTAPARFPPVPGATAAPGLPDLAVVHQFDLMNITITTGTAQINEFLTGVQFGATTMGTPSAATTRTMVGIDLAVSSVMSRLAAAEMAVSNQMAFNKDRIDSMEAGLGALVDADLAKESARLQSLQIRQQLGATALSSANSAPQFLLSLFR